MKRNLYKILNEQFSIGDIVFNDDESDYDANIFNKRTTNPEEVYNNILKGIGAEEFEIQDLNNLVSAYTVKDRNKLLKIIKFYSVNYPEDSLNWIDVSQITNMSNMFEGTDFNNISKYNGDISKWDVSGVTKMLFMFSKSIFDNDISQWDVSNVNDMSCMFFWSKFNKNISQWDVSGVIKMSGMFQHSLFNKDISKWNVSNVRNMYSMFKESKFNQSIADWDVSHVINMNYMFLDSYFNQDISRWDVSNVKMHIYVFARCPIARKGKYKPKFD